MDERFPLDNGQDMTNHQENCTRTSSEVSFCLAGCSRWFIYVIFLLHHQIIIIIIIIINKVFWVHVSHETLVCDRSNKYRTGPGRLSPIKLTRINRENFDFSFVNFQ